VLRAVAREPGSVEAFAREVKRGAGHSAALDHAIAGVADVGRYAAEPGAAAGARRVVERLAVTLQASLLAQHAPAEVADAFIASRIEGGHGHTFGTLEPPLVAAVSARVLDRAFPV
jgi:putative acyl-CoA dehydrogenase